MAISAPNIDVPLNYNAITDRLVVGSRPQALSDIQQLNSISVTTIINVCEVDDAKLLGNFKWIDVGIDHYLFNPNVDDGNPKPASWFKDSIIFGMNALNEPGQVVYVHCYDGIDRGPSTAYAIMRAWGMTHSQARMLLFMARPIAIARYIPDADNAINQGW